MCKFCQRNLFFSEVPKVDLSGFGNELFNCNFERVYFTAHVHCRHVTKCITKYCINFITYNKNNTFWKISSRLHDNTERNQQVCVCVCVCVCVWGGGVEGRKVALFLHYIILDPRHKRVITQWLLSACSNLLLKKKNPSFFYTFFFPFEGQRSLYISVVIIHSIQLKTNFNFYIKLDW